MTESELTLGEAPFTQSSVFNYFSSAIRDPADRDKFSRVRSGEYGDDRSPSDPCQCHHPQRGSGLTVDLSATSAIGQQAADPAQLADYLGMLFMHSQMPTDMRSDLITAISAIPATDLQSRAEVAVYLVVTSSQYKIMH